ncbi:MAG TPA: hypothetical protein VNN74_02290 [Candidatus Micrarchaeia archaeon]|nr:hypothetical protein [Candidatus Micrarchaeia archaeon]
MAPRPRSLTPITWENETRSQRASRRDRLLLLDQVLTVLEEMNLQGEMRVPAPIHDVLHQCGIVCPAGDPPAAVIDRVLNEQGDYLLHPVAIRAKTRGHRPVPPPSRLVAAG